MNRVLVIASIQLSLLVSSASKSQVPSTSLTQLQSIQSKARAAIAPTTAPSTITLDGTFKSVEGSSTQSGNAHLIVKSDGTFVVSLPRHFGPVSESQSMGLSGLTCSWVDQKGVTHPELVTNCIYPAWFFPALALLSSTDNNKPGWVPLTSLSDSAGDHIHFQYCIPSATCSSDGASLGTLELVLTPATHLPASTSFYLAPENASIAQIPIKILYSDYRTIAGVTIPFHIERYVNGALTLDIVVQTASVQ